MIRVGRYMRTREKCITQTERKIILIKTPHIGWILVRDAWNYSCLGVINVKHGSAESSARGGGMSRDWLKA